jgi:hypothetical protein
MLMVVKVVIVVIVVAGHLGVAEGLPRLRGIGVSCA